MGIHRTPEHPWSVEELAAEAAMSRSRFSARFKSLVGETPIGYLTQHRMAVAAEQIEAGLLHADRIAEQAGYESTRVFARAFRRWSGMTPGAYLKRERGKRQAVEQLALGGAG